MSAAAAVICTARAPAMGGRPSTGAFPLHAMLRCSFVFFLLLSGKTALGGQGVAIQSGESYTIRGTVVNSVTRVAVAHALVFSTDSRFAELTDDEGHFEFKVPRPKDEQTTGSQTTFSTFSSAGVRTQALVSLSNVILQARKQGYFQSPIVQPRAGREAGGSEELTIELVPEALIVGRVNLPVLDGTERIQVQAYRRQVQEGRGQWVPAGSVMTRASGEFRFANLQQGDYKLFTTELLDRDPLTFNPRGPQQGYPPVYYPAAGDFESAAVIHLEAGQTFSAGLTPVKRDYHTVKLGVLNAQQGVGFRIQVEPQGHRGPGLSLGYNMDDSRIEGLLPDGSYEVEITQYGENGAAGVLNFSVNGGPVEGPAVMLAANPLIEVRLQDERTNGEDNIPPGTRNLLNAMNLRLIPTDEFDSASYLRLQPSKNPDDETLLFGRTQPGDYRVRAGCSPAGYVASVSSGGRDLLRQPLVVGIGAAVPALEVTVRDDGARVDGTIEDRRRPGQNEPAGNFTGNVPAVILLPLPDSKGQFCETWMTPDGAFHFPQVAPGDYLVMAFEHLPEDLEYGSAEAIKKYESRGQVLRLEARQTEHVQLSSAGGSH
ncbi:MAG TPA: hypothetical protein VJN42_09480 [Candidatus Acidoferrum sp.]|nr:hypothetical protein [Candidatus Acidoferrum sp.]